MTEVPTHPVQLDCRCAKGCAPQVVTRAAYEVYAEVYGVQPAIIEGDCRGGFGVGELVAFLYARSFPRTEWKARVSEAMTGLRLRRG